MSKELEFLIQTIIGGLSTGSIYALIALGFVLIYKATDVLNFAQGELMMMGAFLSFTGIVYFKLSFIPAFLLALVFSAILGFFINVVAIRPMVGKPVFSIVMITIGLATILRSIAGLIFGHIEKPFPSPFPLAQAAKIGGLYISLVHIWTIGVSIIFVILFYFFFKFSTIGIAMKATANEQIASMLQGINIKRIFSLSWGIAAITATVAGIFLASASYIQCDMGFIGLRAFPAIILGGLDSVGGAVIGGFIIGLVENLAGSYLDKALGGGVKEITSYVIVIFIMMIRPYGLFGKEHIERV
ncbi:MAG: branched-chain amino acid ABC transporter permease [Pseudomonadota bacterium]